MRRRSAGQALPASKLYSKLARVECVCKLNCSLMKCGERGSEKIYIENEGSDGFRVRWH